MYRFALTPFLFFAVVASTFACDLEIHFSPRGGSTDESPQGNKKHANVKKQTCTDVIVKEIEQARSTIIVEAYKFNSPRIANAMLAAARGKFHVTVSVILDNKGYNQNFWVKLLQPGDKIEFEIDHLHTNHNKLIVIDSKVVLTGSFNLTTQAETYAENLLVIRREAIAAQYKTDWDVHWKHSQPKIFPLAPPPTPKIVPPPPNKTP
jgi:phosphatidylserine/phosphatidylglycerophosphate/cardiolipin synthase-like enzyme